MLSDWGVHWTAVLEHQHMAIEFDFEVQQIEIHYFRRVNLHTLSWNSYIFGDYTSKSNEKTKSADNVCSVFAVNKYK